jgi:hypothetical protein
MLKERLIEDLVRNSTVTADLSAFVHGLDRAGADCEIGMATSMYLKEASPEKKKAGRMFAPTFRTCLYNPPVHPWSDRRQISSFSSCARQSRSRQHEKTRLVIVLESLVVRGPSHLVEDLL